MGHDAASTKRPVNMTLNADLVRRARKLTPNLSETVETLLTSYVEVEEAKRADIAAQIAQWAAASNAVVDRHGSPADEHDPF